MLCTVYILSNDFRFSGNLIQSGLHKSISPSCSYVTPTLTSDLEKSRLLVGIKVLPELSRESMRASVVMLCNTLYDSIVH